MSTVVGPPERCPGHDEGGAGRHGGEEQDDAPDKPRAGVVSDGERHPDRRPDECRDRGGVSAGRRAWPLATGCRAAFSSNPSASARSAEASVWPTTSAPPSRGPTSSPRTPWRHPNAGVRLRATPPPRLGRQHHRVPVLHETGPDMGGAERRRPVPATGARIAAAARPMRPRRDGRSSRRPSGIRRVLGSAAAGATTAWRAKLLGWAARATAAHGPFWPPTNPAEHHDHRSGVGADHALVVALRRRAVRSCRIGERRVGARAAIRVQRATEHHP
jgi:hypothetical protein